MQSFIRHARSRVTGGYSAPNKKVTKKVESLRSRKLGTHCRIEVKRISRLMVELQVEKEARPEWSMECSPRVECL